ncbi:MAG: hypothetical protein RMA76_29495 [Deltaproteobacteria bacterium]
MSHEPIDSAAAFARLSQKIDDDQSIVGWLKSRPTWVHKLIAGLTVVGATLFGVVFLRRPDLDAYPVLRMTVSIGAIAAVLFVSLGWSLRPMHKRALPPWAVAAMAVGAVALSFGLAITPTHYAPDPAHLPHGAEWVHALRCLYFGALVGLPVYVVGRLLDRTRDPSRAVLAAGAAGLTGQLVLLLHCPISDPTHLVTGHASVVAVFLALVWFVVRVERRIRRRAVA